MVRNGKAVGLARQFGQAARVAAFSTTAVAVTAERCRYQRSMALAFGDVMLQLTSLARSWMLLYLGDAEPTMAHQRLHASAAPAGGLL